MLAQCAVTLEADVCARLRIAPSVYWSSTPADLCVMLRAERLRVNDEIRRVASWVSAMVMPHINQKYRHLFSQRRMAHSTPGYDPDEGDE